MNKDKHRDIAVVSVGFGGRVSETELEMEGWIEEMVDSAAQGEVGYVEAEGEKEEEGNEG